MVPSLIALEIVVSLWNFPGIGMVIAGWDEALMSMKKGERRKLIIPANLGYGRPRNSRCNSCQQYTDFEDVGID